MPGGVGALEAVTATAAIGAGLLALVRARHGSMPWLHLLACGVLGAGLLHAWQAWVLTRSLVVSGSPGVAGGWGSATPGILLGIVALTAGLAVRRSPGARGGGRSAEPAPISRDTARRILYGTIALALLLGAAAGFGILPTASGGIPALVPDLLGGVLLLAAFTVLVTAGRDPGDPELRAGAALLLLAGIAHFLVPGTGAAGLAVLLSGGMTTVGYALLAGAAVHGFTTAASRDDSAATALRAATAELAREVRNRKETERISREAETRLQEFLDHAQDLIQSTDPEGGILYVNESWKRRLGYTDADLPGRTIYDFLHPASKAGYREAMGRVFQGRAVPEFPVTLLARDGSRVICTGTAAAHFENGRPIATRSILRDRSEERRAARELRDFQANLRAVFESTGDAIWSVDRQCRLLTFNTAYSLLLEVITDRTPRVGDPLDALVSEEALPWFQSCYDRALAGNRFSAVREERVDGQLRTFELYFNPIEGAEGGPTGVVVFSRDVTRRKKVEEALIGAKQEAEEASRTKSQFLANMSHELRTPLNSIIGFANILLKKHGDGMPERERGYLDRILVNGKHLLTLINEILDLSKIEAGRMELQVEAVDLRALARETMAQLEPQVAGTRVRLLWEVEGDPAPFRTDRGKLKQVLINLVANALKFTEDGSVTVRVETTADGRTPSGIAVVDTGIGIPEDRLDAIFQAFQQADSGTARRFGGTGLGLTISRSLCGLMGYDLRVESEFGSGSTFRVEFGTGPPGRDDRPLAGLDRPPAERWSGIEGMSPDESLKGRKVLVVDDEADSRDLLIHYLGDLGCRVITAGDGVEGLEVARRELPDLITVDLMMPRMSGWDFLRAVREDPSLRDTPVVVVSIVAEEGGGQVLGTVDLLDKPVEREELARTLARNLSRGGRRILVVEDDDDSRTLLTRYLREAGLQVAGVEDGMDALRHLERHPVDLVLLDLVMPGMDGFSVLSRIRESDALARIPVVVLTAKDLEREEEKLLEGYGVRVIQKGDAVERHLRSVLDRLFGIPAPR